MKTSIPDDFLDSMAEKFKMLGDASRLRILKALMEQELNVTDIVERTKLTQANVSKHLKLLTSVGMIKRRKAGLNVFYKIIDPALERICSLVCGTIGNATDSANRSRSREKRR